MLIEYAGELWTVQEIQYILQQYSALEVVLREALPKIRTALELAAARPSALDMCEATHTALDMLGGLEMAVEEVGNDTPRPAHDQSTLKALVVQCSCPYPDLSLTDRYRCARCGGRVEVTHD
jgi:hypothetical protein